MYTTQQDPDGLGVRGNTSLASCTLADLPLELHPDGKIDEGDRPSDGSELLGIMTIFYWQPSDPA